jgi:hypothetical protein
MSLRMSNLYIFILSVFFASIANGQTGEIFINKKSSNHTINFIEVISSCDSIFINEGVYYLDFNKIFLRPNVVIIAKGIVEIHAVGNSILPDVNPSALFTAVNPKNISINNIKFCDIHNRAYAIKIVNTNIEATLKSNIEIYCNRTEEIGLVWIGPKGGFTFNRIGIASANLSWYENGPILKSNWASYISIRNNIISGDSSFISGNFIKPKIGVSAITILYANNIESNLISNFRFGIWIYGGSSLDRKKEVISFRDPLCKNIFIKDNKVYETYSPIWFSKCSDIFVSNNLCKNNQDVALDFEGCLNASVVNNKVINSRGGALTVLNGSANIYFFSNIIELNNFDAKNNIVVIRNGNVNIDYRSNKFLFYDNRFLKKNARILFSNTNDKIGRSDNITFRDNLFSKVYIDIKDDSNVFKN